MDTKSAIYTCVGAIVASTITAAAMYFTNERTLEEQRIESDRQRIEERRVAVENKSLAKIYILNTYVPRINTNIDSVFYTEIANESGNQANDLLVTVNFGGTTIRQCETLPNNQVGEDSIKNGSILILNSLDLLPGERIYIYCQTSSPVFESITVSGKNLVSSAHKSIDSLRTRIKIDNSNGYATFFKVIACIIALIFAAYFTVVCISILNKKMKPYLGE